MAYQNVGTPRFWVNTTEYYDSLGMITDGTIKTYGHMYLDPTTDRIWRGGNLDGVNDTSTLIFNRNVNGIYGDKCFLALLGHNLHSAVADYHIQSFGVSYDTYTDAVELVNVNVYGDGIGLPRKDGFSITTFDGSSAQDGNTALSVKMRAYGDAVYDATPRVNSVIIGEYYDMPHSPDLNLKMTIEMDGVKTIQSKGGATLSNASYTKPADWGSMGAWQLGGASNLRNGRRVWDLSFSYLSDTDVFPINASTGYENITSSGYNTTADPVDINTNEDLFFTNVLSGSDFFSVVWNKTMGGHLPFIFQPDNNNNNPDQFAIARFDMNSLTYDQVANNVYNVKLKIRESW